MTVMMYQTKAIRLIILSVVSKLIGTLRFMVVENITTFTHSKTVKYNSIHISLVQVGKTWKCTLCITES